MATRSRTLLFLQYRNSFSHTHRTHVQPEVNGSAERAGLIAGADQDNETIIELSVLPPQWVDMVDEINEIVEEIKEKMSKLEGLHKKHLLPGFDDNREEEQIIENLTSEITQDIQNCHKRIKLVDPDKGHNSLKKENREGMLNKNVQISLATKVQEISAAFRKQQSTYLEKLRAPLTRNKDLFMMGDDESEFTFGDEDGFNDSQLALVESSEEAIEQREREINEIAKSIGTLAEIFRELQTLVIDQGTLLDRIDYNVEQVAMHMNSAVEELEQGATYQKSSGRKMLVILLLLLILGMIIALIFRLGTR
ncbi:t-SNARE affecting a late Golgi compartment protein 2 [Basidiobolus ranarum]|uniref:t-SNARE affecting a late Golgi compartment protein 2 n=2 Tax=Basidiobolus ranarum TaxID=34480 RepID=A0ABR2W7W0_9FUNG